MSTSRVFGEELLEHVASMYEEFEKYQALALSTLAAFCDVCDMNGIKYQLAWGSLLGAVRDNGQIPWDYDIDVFVPHDERARLIDALGRDLNDGYYFYGPETSQECRHYLLRIAPRGYETVALHVDVFFLIGAPSEEKARRAFTGRMKRIALARYWKKIDPNEESMGSKSLMLYYKFLKTLHSMIPLRLLDACYWRLCGQYSLQEAEYFTEADPSAPQGVFPRRLLDETERIYVNERAYSVSKRREELLEAMYGDFRKYPSMESRFSEFYGSLKRLKYFDSSGNSRKDSVDDE